jgi:hypothetical protein
MLNVIYMLGVTNIAIYAECIKAECPHAECHNDECRGPF